MYLGSQLVLPDCKQLPDDVESGDCVHIGLQTTAKVLFNTRMSSFPLGYSCTAIALLSKHAVVWGDTLVYCV